MTNSQMRVVMLAVPTDVSHVTPDVTHSPAMSDLVLPSQQMPQGEPAAVVLSSEDEDSDCVEIPAPRPGVARKQKAQRASAVARDPLFAEFWDDRPAATLAVTAHSTAHGRRYTSPSL